jgi:pilus assembly protein Flp/PilA
MLKLIQKAQSRFIKDESGATAIEYGLIAVAISVAIAASVFTFGDELVAVFEGLSGSLANPN